MVFGSVDTALGLAPSVPLVAFILDIFETPVTVTPQQEISKTLNSSKIPLKILSVYFWGKNVYFWGENVYFWGMNVYFWCFFV